MSETIDVAEIDETTFEVTVEARTTTTHRVTVDPEVHQRLTDGQVTPRTLVERSFEFLLEREPNTAILPSFDLPVIGRYFPEYESEIRQRTSG
ncbi:MAG: hypothetical protein ACOC5E_00470 [Acidobacteriota bacterium]